PWKLWKPVWMRYCIAVHYPNIAGINTSILEINPFVPAYVGSYQCVVSHVPSDKEIMTNAANLYLGKLLSVRLVYFFLFLLVPVARSASSFPTAVFASLVARSPIPAFSGVSRGD
ncbi:MAG: hypothetical protein MJE68_21160, partial [Proteobacteria bacterium]|nr:hypothetical protein [Pseudomonadota bacterium]